MARLLTLTDFDPATSRKVFERNPTDGFLRARANRGLQRTCEVSQHRERTCKVREHRERKRCMLERVAEDLRREREWSNENESLARALGLKMRQHGGCQLGGGGSPAPGESLTRWGRGSRRNERCWMEGHGHMLGWLALALLVSSCLGIVICPFGESNRIKSKSSHSYLSVSLASDNGIACILVPQEPP